jgi:hypothetical protein
VLATAKLEPKFVPGTSAAEFPTILVGNTGQDFVEVHIFGALHRGSIGRIVARKPKTEVDRILLEEIKRHKAVEFLQ